MNSIIALRISENDQINDLYERFYDKTQQIENKFETNVFLFSMKRHIYHQSYLLKKKKKNPFFIHISISNNKMRKLNI